MSKKRQAVIVDEGLQQIDAWGDWFISAHTERLRGAGLTPIEREREDATIQAQAAAIVSKMRDDYRARYHR